MTGLSVKVVLETDPGAVCLRLSGDFDMVTEAAYFDALRKAQALQPASVRLDLSSLSFLDSGGLRCILQTHEWAAGSGVHLTLVGGPPNVQRVFRISGVEKELTFVEPAPLSSPVNLPWNK